MENEMFTKTQAPLSLLSHSPRKCKASDRRRKTTLKGAR